MEIIKLNYKYKKKMIINGLKVEEQKDPSSYLKVLGKTERKKKEFTATMVAPNIFPDDSDPLPLHCVENLRILPQSIDPNLIPFDCIKYKGVPEFRELNNRFRNLLFDNERLWTNRFHSHVFNSSEFYFLYENFSRYYDFFSIFQVTSLFNTKEKFDNYISLLLEYLKLQYKNYEIIYPFSKNRYLVGPNPYGLIDYCKKLRTNNLSISWQNPNCQPFPLQNLSDSVGVGINSIVSDINFNPIKSFDLLMDRRNSGIFPFVFPDYIVKYAYGEVADGCDYKEFYVKLTGINYTSDSLLEGERFTKSLNEVKNPIFQTLIEDNLAFSNNIQATKNLPNLIDKLYEIVKDRNRILVTAS